MEEVKKLKKGKRKLVEEIDESASSAKIKKKKHKSKERKIKAKENLEKRPEFQTQSEILECEVNSKKDKKKKKKKLMPVKVDTIVASNKVTEEEKKITGKKRKKSKKMIETMTDQQTANTTIDIDSINENSGPEALKSENRKVKKQKHKKKSKNVYDDNKIKNSKTKPKDNGEETSTAEQHEPKNTVDSNTASSNGKLKKKRRKKVLTEETATPVCLQKDLTTVDFNKNEESKIVPVNDQKNQTCAFGQWSSVQFGDSDRQTKFLRLMGGKKSSVNKTGLWSGKNTFSKAAMNVSQAKQLENRLEGQFQNALEFNLQKRTEKNMTKGLGFEEDPAKGKKFHIDVNKINSIKFD